jgi:hypothetical protein
MKGAPNSYTAKPGQPDAGCTWLMFSSKAFEPNRSFDTQLFWQSGGSNDIYQRVASSLFQDDFMYEACDFTTTKL